MPSDRYWISLALVAAVALVGRLVVGRPLLPGRARAIGWPNAGLGVAALLALGFHCAAMFFTDRVSAIPGTDGAVSAITTLGTASKVAYAVPAVLVLVALRTVWPPALAVFALALLAVGVTMYWWHGLDVHLAAIASSVVSVTFIASGLVRFTGSPPSAPGRGLRTTAPQPS